MPFLNAAGRIAHGTGGMGAFLDNVAIDTGGGACWYNPTTIIYQHGGGDGYYLNYYNINSGVKSRAHDLGANQIFGSGTGVWAAWLAGTGVFSSVAAYELPAAGLLGMGADGAMAYRPDYQGSGLRIRELSGNDYWLSDGPAMPKELAIVGQNQVFWTEGPSVVKTAGLPPTTVLTGPIYQPHAVLLDGLWWVAYYSSIGAVLHPINSTTGYRPVTPDPAGDAWFDITVLSSAPHTIRFAWSSTAGEIAGDVHFVDINVTTAPRTNLGTGAIVPEHPMHPGIEIPPISIQGYRTLTSQGTFEVYGASEELITLPLEVWPSFPVEGGYGRIVHPVLGAFDYEVKPDEWVNIDADAIIAPVWASTRTLTGAANVLWNGNLRDVVVEERWKALGGLAMPITQLRMLMAIWTMPVDPDVGYVIWYPNYITQEAFKVLPVGLSSGGQGITFDDVVNYKDENGEPIGWMTNPVTFTLKLVERLV